MSSLPCTDTTDKVESDRKEKEGISFGSAVHSRDQVKLDFSMPEMQSYRDIDAVDG